MKFFKPEDFGWFNCMSPEDKIELAKQANAKLEREGKRVYCRVGKDILHSERMDVWLANKQPNPDWDTHQALLIAIDPVETKPCEHSVVVMDQPMNFRCSFCLAKLTPTKWEKVKNEENRDG